MLAREVEDAIDDPVMLRGISRRALELMRGAALGMYSLKREMIGEKNVEAW